MLRGECHHMWTSKGASRPVVWVSMVARQVHSCEHVPTEWLKKQISEKESTVLMLHATTVRIQHVNRHTCMPAMRTGPT